MSLTNETSQCSHIEVLENGGWCKCGTLVKIVHAPAPKPLTNERGDLGLWWVAVAVFVAISFWTIGFFNGRTYELRREFCQEMREMGHDMKGYCDGF